ADSSRDQFSDVLIIEDNDVPSTIICRIPASPDKEFSIFQVPACKDAKTPAPCGKPSAELIQLRIAGVASIVLALDENVGCPIVLRDPSEEAFSRPIRKHYIDTLSATVDVDFFFGPHQMRSKQRRQESKCAVVIVVCSVRTGWHGLKGVQQTHPIR